MSINVENPGSITPTTNPSTTTLFTSFTSKQIIFATDAYTICGNTNLTWNNDNTRLGIGTNTPAATLDITQLSQTSGSPNIFCYTGAPHTTLSSCSETIDGYFKLDRNIQFNAGPNSIQRAIYISAPTYSFTGPSVIDTAATFAVGNGPQAGNNAKLNNSYSIWAMNGVAAFDGHIKVDGILFDLSAGATTNQVLTYDGTKFIAANVTGNLFGTHTTTKIPYATSPNTLTDSGLTWNNNTLTVTTSNNTAGIQLTDNTYTIGLTVNSISNSGQLGTLSNHNLSFFTNNKNPQMTLTTAGNFGVGVIPGYKLDVSGDINTSARLLIQNSSAPTSSSGNAGFRFNATTNHLETSENGAKYTRLTEDEFTINNASSINLDPSVASYFRCLAGSANMMINGISGNKGQTIKVAIIQDNSGNRIVSFNNNFVLNAAYFPSKNPDAIDLFMFQWDNVFNKWLELFRNIGLAA